MSTSIRHASAVKPISVSVKADIDPQNWDRVQAFNPATSQPTESLYEIGRLAKMVSEKGILEATLSITQLEYGTIDVFKQLAGLSAEPSGGFDLDDFSSSWLDFYLPGKDEYAGTLEQTLWLQHMVVDSFGISMNADEKIERTFEFSGELAKILRYGNKYLIFKTDDAPSGTSGSYAIVVSDPAPVINPNPVGGYILDIWRIRSGVATQLVLATDYTYTAGTNTINIISASASDHYRIWYSAASYGSAGDPTALNDSDDYYLKADNVTITIDDGVNAEKILDKLTSLSVDVTFNRIDEAVIGSNEKILKDVESYDVSWSVEGFVKNSDIEEALMGQTGQNWEIVDFTLFIDIMITAKIYQEASKTTFLIGYQSTACEYADSNEDYTANEFANNSFSFSSENLKITTTISDL